MQKTIDLAAALS